MMKRRHVFRVFLPALAALLTTGLQAPPVDAADKNLPVPRFVTLRTDPVNVRAGPGERYPIEWVYHRKDLPVEIIAEFENWRKIRDADGTTGWVHERMVTGRRSVLVQGEVRNLHEEAKSDAPTVARAEPGVVAKLLECGGDWCRIEAGGVSGWLKREEIWGVYPAERIP
jgi:SH3-like domain-containing protein